MISEQWGGFGDEHVNSSAVLFKCHPEWVLVSLSSHKLAGEGELPLGV